jgi:hypothetical protein
MPNKQKTLHENKERKKNRKPIEAAATAMMIND